MNDKIIKTITKSIEQALQEYKTIPNDVNWEKENINRFRVLTMSFFNTLSKKLNIGAKYKKELTKLQEEKQNNIKESCFKHMINNYIEDQVPIRFSLDTSRRVKTLCYLTFDILKTKININMKRGK